MTKVPFGYLGQQFEDPSNIFDDLKALVASGDFTLGKPLSDFESCFAAKLGVRHAIGVNSGTDALKLSLWAADVGPGDEVITAANTFIATVGAINEVRARAVFVDCDSSFCLDVDQIESAITANTKAIIPVHLTGNMADMPRIMEIADRHGIKVIEDACQAICSAWEGKAAGTFGLSGCFSLHPLKFLNIWGDGGVCVTNDDAFATKLRLLRNHGLLDRDTVTILGCNSRLDTLQAVVASHVLKSADEIIAKRNENAAIYDEGLRELNSVSTPQRNSKVLHTFVTYQLLAQDRDQLLKHCIANGVDAKVHYPTPVYCQPGLEKFGYKAGAFPVSDLHAATTITLPVHQYVTEAQLRHTINVVSGFYG